MPEQILELSTPHQFFNQFFTEVLLAKIAEETNLYSSQMNPNKPMKCTVYDIQDLWSDVLGINLVKETMSQEHFEKIRSCSHISGNSEQPSCQSPNYDKLYKLRLVLD
jgi:hypothetical protein